MVARNCNGNKINWNLRALLCFFALMASIVLPSSATGQSNYYSTGDTMFIESYTFLIHFETNRHQTDTLPENDIKKLLSALEDHPEFSVRMEARTDSIGSPEYNRRLAQRRLDFTREELEKRGVENKQFIEYVYGEDTPLASNQTASGRKINRSVKVQAGMYRPVQMISGRFSSEAEKERDMKGVILIGTRFYQDTFAVQGTGVFCIPVPKGENFSLEFFSKDHYMEPRFFNPARTGPGLGVIHPTKLQAGNQFDFRDILFYPRTAKVYLESLYELPRLLMMISQAADYRFEIQGHVNFPPGIRSAHNLQELSEKRAKSIFNYLVDNGVDSTRLEWKGYANRRMIYPRPENSQQEHKNMRVSLKILDEFLLLAE